MPMDFLFHFIVPALNPRSYLLGKDGGWGVLRNSSYHLVFFFFFFSIPEFLSYGFALFNRVSLGFPFLLLFFLFSFRRKRREGKTFEERILISLINLHTRIYEFLLCRVESMAERFIFLFRCKNCFFFFLHINLAFHKAQVSPPKFLSIDQQSDRRYFFPFHPFLFFRPKIHEFSTNQRIVKAVGAALLS